MELDLHLSPPSDDDTTESPDSQQLPPYRWRTPSPTRKRSRPKKELYILNSSESSDESNDIDESFPEYLARIQSRPQARSHAQARPQPRVLPDKDDDSTVEMGEEDDDSTVEMDAIETVSQFLERTKEPVEEDELFRQIFRDDIDKQTNKVNNLYDVLIRKSTYEMSEIVDLPDELFKTLIEHRVLKLDRIQKNSPELDNPLKWLRSLISKGIVRKMEYGDATNLKNAKLRNLVHKYTKKTLLPPKNINTLRKKGLIDILIEMGIVNPKPVNFRPGKPRSKHAPAAEKMHKEYLMGEKMQYQDATTTNRETLKLFLKLIFPSASVSGMNKQEIIRQLQIKDAVEYSERTLLKRMKRKRKLPAWMFSK